MVTTPRLFYDPGEGTCQPTRRAVTPWSRKPLTRRCEVTWVLLDATGEGGGVAASSDLILARALVRLARIPLDVNDPREVPHRTALQCQEAFPVPVRVTVTVGNPVTPEFVASDSQDAQVVDGAQLMAGEGPCVEAWRTVSLVSSGDVRTDPRWPRLSRYLGDAEVRSAVAAPLVKGGGPFGVLSVYAERDGLDDEVAREAAALLASTATTVLEEVFSRCELERLAGNLRTALDSRATIDQAKGIVMARHGCDPDEAFRILVNLSSNSNVKLREIAARLVAETSALRSRRTDT
jgi:GAF domain-containing protein